MKNLFSDFKPVDYESWITRIKKDLKDQPIDVLVSHPEKDIEIKAYHHPVKNNFAGISNSFSNQPSKPSNEWRVRQSFGPGSNKKILADLEDGVDAVGLTFENQQQFDADTAGVLFEHISSDISFATKEAALKCKVPATSYLNFDVISRNAKSGNSDLALADFFSFYKAHSNKNIWANASVYGDAGATTIQELAFALAHLNEYIQFLHANGESIERINSKIILELSVNENYFVNIAKFRTIRELVALLFTGYDAGYVASPVVVYAKTGVRYLAHNDRHNNLLRATTQAMSAIAGGCDALTIAFLPGEENERITKNIQLVLREEAYFDKVVDPSAGAYFIEGLEDQLIEKAWKLFVDIENKGGLIACMKNNTIQGLIEENQRFLVQQMNEGKRTFLGVNKFQNKLENRVEVNAPQNYNETEFQPLHPFRLEEFYAPKTVAP